METIKKMDHAPLTNSGCESRMAELDVRVNFSGGSAPIDTLSDKQIFAANNCLISEEFDKHGAKELFKWTRTSEKAKKALELQNYFLSQVIITKSLSLKAKQVVKQRKTQKAVKLAASCHSHGVPVTADNLDLLEALS
jgi:hypothetical protein